MLAQQLDPSQFARIRRDAMIRYDAIQTVRTGTFGTLEITLVNQQKLTTSRTLDAQIKLNLLAHTKSPK
jgi:DNA-binding LytR/AlgR family response regulator